MLEYTSPPIWLNAHIQDPRVTVGEYTYFNRHICLAVFQYLPLTIEYQMIEDYRSKQAIIDNLCRSKYLTHN
jgi:hypothetical protein